MKTFNGYQQTMGMRNDLFNSYMNEIEKDIMTPEEEKDAFTRLANGDESARNEIIKANQLFIIKVARAYANEDNLMDLISEGNIGMLKAFEDYDYTKGIRFLSFAVWYIRREIGAYLLNYKHIVKKSNNAKTTSRLCKVENDFIMREMRNPTIDELRDELKEKYNLDIKDDADLYTVRESSIEGPLCDSDSEDSIMYEDSRDFNDKTAIDNEYVNDEEQEYAENLVNVLFAKLSDREKKIIKMSYGIGYDRSYAINEIAEKVGLTRERVRQIKDECEVKMKRYSKVAMQHVG